MSHQDLDGNRREAPLSCVEYLIVPDSGMWKIALGLIEYSPYKTVEQAIEAAVEAAHAAGKSGFSARVLMLDGWGWRVVWTFGMDQYPPWNWGKGAWVQEPRASP